jgi:protein ImuA
LRGAIVWCDPQHTLYPPAVAAAGVPLEKLFLLYPSNPAEQLWAITECLRCKGVAATIAQVSSLSRIEARRLQLAAERGGGVGILLRRLDRNASIYAAATRWLVCPCQGLRTVQRWKIQLIHAHGGRIGQTVILEHHREENLVCAVDQLADRPGQAGNGSIRVSA